MWLLNSICLLALWFTYNEAQSLEQVVCSFVIFKEGDRTPLINYPNDENNAIWSSTSVGQLTEVGKVKMYEFGRFLNKRYSRKIVQTRVEQQLQVHSFKYERNILAAKKVVEGFLGTYSENHTLPILSIEGADVEAEGSSTNECPLFKRELKRYLSESSQLSVLATEGETYIQKVKRFTNCPYESLADLKVCIDPLLCEVAEGLTLPNWCDRSCYEHLKFLYEKQLELEVSVPKLLNLKLQPLVHLVIGRLREFAQNIRQKFKLFMISALGDTIPLILRACEVTNMATEIADFGASIILELKQRNGAFFVSLFYRTPQSSFLKKLTLKGCLEDCELTRFIQIVPPILKKNRFSCQI